MMVVALHFWGFEPGYAGVGFFFVLSGYVLRLNYRSFDKADFWWRRFARIYPLHIITLMLTIPLGWSLFATLPNVVLMQSWIPVRGIYFAGNPPSWSLSNEAFFYALFPFLRVGGKTLLIWAAAILSIAATWTIAFPSWTMSEGGVVFLLGRSFETPLTEWVFTILPPMRLFEFALGMYIADLKSVALGLKAEVTAIALAIFSILALPLFPPAFTAAIFFIPASAALVFVFANSSGPVSRLLATKTLVLLGNASFALYMIHLPLGIYLGHSFLVVILCIGLSMVLFLYFERPLQGWLIGIRVRSPTRSIL